MNEQFTDEQIKAYASAFEEGDAIYVNNSWKSVLKISDYPEYLVASEEEDGYENPFFIKSPEGGSLIGFFEDEKAGVVHPLRVTTLEHYESQGGEKIVWLGESNSFFTFGKVYEIDSDGRYRDDTGDFLIAKSSLWGVIPTYKKVLVKQLEEAVGTLPVENMTVDEFEEDGLDNELLELLGKKYLTLEDKHMSIYNERRELESKVARKQNEMNKLDELMSDISKVIQSLENTVK